MFIKVIYVGAVSLLRVNVWIVPYAMLLNFRAKLLVLNFSIHKNYSSSNQLILKLLVLVNSLFLVPIVE